MQSLSHVGLFSLLLTGCPGSDKDNDDTGETDSGTDDTGTDDTGTSVDADGDGSPAGEDCDDADAAVNPEAAEVCDGLDNDCDGATDLDDSGATGLLIVYADADGDSYGDPATGAQACEAGAGQVADDTDCDDGAATVNPAATEACDGLDNDCDGATDAEDDSLTGAITVYADGDGDGYGDPATATRACAIGAGQVTDSTDHDDTDASVWRTPDAWVGDLSSGFAGFCTGYGARRIEGTLDLYAATQADVDALSCLTEVTGTLYVAYNNALTDVDGLSALTSVGGGLYVYYDPALTDLGGLSALTSIGSNLHIGYNGALTDVDGFAALSSIGGSLTIENNDALTDLDGFAALSSIGGDLSVFYNDALCQSSIDDLSARLAGSGLTGTATISDNGAACVEDADGDGVSTPTDYDDTDASVWLAPDTYVGDLSSVTGFCTGYRERRIEGDLTLTLATQADVDALTCLTEVTGDLDLAYNVVLTDVDGLSALTSVGGFLYFYRNDALIDVDGLAALTSVGGFLYVEDNDALTDLDGLSALTSIGGLLYIFSNAALTNVDGLSALSFIGGDVFISYNTALCESSTDALRARLAASGYAGGTYIGFNLSGC